jgi:WXG100 family type VII secretion target
MGDMQITYEDMRNAAKDLEDGQSEIETRLTSLKNGIDGLVAAGFVTGSASKEFETSYTEFDKGVRQVIEGLQGMGKYLRSAADAYEQTDQELAKALKG